MKLNYVLPVLSCAFLCPTFAFGQQINVLDATYGANCGVSRGNVSLDVKTACDGDVVCLYDVSHIQLGDPAPQCAKEYEVRYECGNRLSTVSFASAEASGKAVWLSCQNAYSSNDLIRVKNASYGFNCGASRGNVTNDVADYCTGYGSCQYRVSHYFLGDPTPQCAKDFRVEYYCGSQLKSAFVSGEASGQSISLNCN